MSIPKTSGYNEITMNSHEVKIVKKRSKGRTFQCTGYPGCNMTFTRSEHLARHIRKHTGERPFECVHCSRKFSRLDNLRQHKQTVHVNESTIDHLDMVNNGNTNSITQSGNVNMNNDQRNKIRSNSNTTDNVNMNKPLPPLPQQVRQHYTTDILTQNGEDLEAAKTLLRPTQFHPKHRPRPIDLPSRKAVYNDTGPYTVPTPNSENSGYLATSPTSASFTQSQYPSTALPSIHFLSSTGAKDILSSPYNSSFALSGQSETSTPLSSHYDTLRTPNSFQFNTSVSSSSSGYNQQHQQQMSFQPLQPTLPTPQQLHHQQNADRKSWLSNVLNSNGDTTRPEYSSLQSLSSSLSSSSSASSTLLITNNIGSTSPLHVRTLSTPTTTHELEKKVRIESLLNNEERKIALPHVDALGINVSSKIK